MALNDERTFVVGEGHFYAAPVGTALPADLSNIGEPWEEIGHTSADDPLTISSDGGDTNVLPSLQNKKLRTITTPATRQVELKFLQFDETTLKYYLGANAYTENGLMYEPDNPSPVEMALLGVFQDGDHYFVLHMRRAQAAANGDFEAEDSENFTSFPVKFTALNERGKKGALGYTGVVDKNLKPIAATSSPAVVPGRGSE